MVIKLNDETKIINEYNNGIFPIDIYKKDDTEKIIRGMNFNLFKSLELYDTKNLKSSNIKSYSAYMISNKFTEADEKILKEINLIDI